MVCNLKCVAVVWFVFSPSMIYVCGVVLMFGNVQHVVVVCGECGVLSVCCWLLLVCVIPPAP